MTTGETLTALERIIHEFAKRRLETSGLDATLAEIVMGNVYRHFQEDAYHASLLNQFSAAQEKDAQEEAQPPKGEMHSGTVEDLMEELKQNDVLRGQG